MGMALPPTPCDVGLLWQDAGRSSGARRLPPPERWSVVMRVFTISRRCGQLLFAGADRRASPHKARTRARTWDFGSEAYVTAVSRL
jgi:hypothetical protein